MTRVVALALLGLAGLLQRCGAVALDVSVQASSDVVAKRLGKTEAVMVSLVDSWCDKTLTVEEKRDETFKLMLAKKEGPMDALTEAEKEESAFFRNVKGICFMQKQVFRKIKYEDLPKLAEALSPKARTRGRSSSVHAAAVAKAGAAVSTRVQEEAESDVDDGYDEDEQEDEDADEESEESEESTEDEDEEDAGEDETAETIESQWGEDEEDDGEDDGEDGEALRQFREVPFQPGRKAAVERGPTQREAADSLQIQSPSFLQVRAEFSLDEMPREDAMQWCKYFNEAGEDEIQPLMEARFSMQTAKSKLADATAEEERLQIEVKVRESVKKSWDADVTKLSALIKKLREGEAAMESEADKAPDQASRKAARSVAKDILKRHRKLAGTMEEVKESRAQSAVAQAAQIDKLKTRMSELSKVETDGAASMEMSKAQFETAATKVANIRKACQAIAARKRLR